MSPVGSNIRAGSTVFSTKEVSTTSVPDGPDAAPPELPDVVPPAPDEVAPLPHAATATVKADTAPAAANRDILMNPAPTSQAGLKVGKRSHQRGVPVKKLMFRPCNEFVTIHAGNRVLASHVG